MSPIDPKVLRSDMLAGIRPLLAQSRELTRLIGVPLQFRFIVDTNVVLKDLFWLSKRNRASVRTSLQELSASETVVFHAPEFLRIEVEKHLPRISQDAKVELAHIQKIWSEYSELLVWVQIEPEEIRAAREGDDEKDLVFLAAEKKIMAHGIVTDDSDISRMGGAAIQVDCLIYLRDYARSASIELNIKLAGYWGSTFSVEAIRRLFQLIRKLVISITELPPPVKLILLSAALFVVIHPASREKAIGILRGVTTGASDLIPELVNTISELARLAAEHGSHANEALAALPPEFPWSGYKGQSGTS